jgi:hypothetical protein
MTQLLGPALEPFVYLQLAGFYPFLEQPKIGYRIWLKVRSFLQLPDLDHLPLIRLAGARSSIRKPVFNLHTTTHSL